MCDLKTKTSSRRRGYRNVSGFARVFGDLYGEECWDSICWLQLGQICDPRVSTGPLQRYPFTGTDPCNSNNPDWPTAQDVENALSIDEYDALALVASCGFSTCMQVPLVNLIL